MVCRELSLLLRGVVHVFGIDLVVKVGCWFFYFFWLWPGLGDKWGHLVACYLWVTLWGAFMQCEELGRGLEGTK